MYKSLLFLLTVLSANLVQAQTWPIEWKISSDGRQLSCGQEATGFYDQNVIRQVQFNFPQTNYWTLLTSNYASNTNLICNINIDGVMFDSCGVRFRGQTSYTGGPGGGGGSTIGNKKSFNVNMDDVRTSQDVMGYSSLNFLNSFQDPSFLREVIFFQLIRKHIPTAKANFSHLRINGGDWGLYANVQNLNKDFYKEWFLTNDGANFRADAGTSPGGSWGDGNAALNNKGTDSTIYDNYYTLKSSDISDPWKQLMEVCNVLDTVSLTSMEEVLNDYLDIDRALWYLASEIAFCDDDSYIYKGKMDYYIYEEKETSRLAMIQFDGNSSFTTSLVNTWTPFHNSTNVNYPLMHRLMQVPTLRQRYLAHMRTIVKDEFNSTEVDSLIDHYKNMVDSIVAVDPEKIYTYAQFNSEMSVLKNFIINRRNYLNSNAEMNVVPPTISEVSFTSTAGEWMAPIPFEATHVRAKVNSSFGLSKVKLYYSNSIVGKFSSIEMFDDGAHNDYLAGDGVFGADIPGFNGTTWVRYYIEATANNTAKTVSYMPEGAEHNVYVYQVTGALTDLNESSSTQNIILSPNPASEYFDINMSDLSQVKNIEIFQLDGKSVQSISKPQDDQINVRELIPGTYIVRIILQNGISFEQKLVKM